MLIKWNMFELESQTDNLIGRKLRGSIRKFSIENKINILLENAEDKQNCLRFCLISDEDFYKNLRNIDYFLETQLEKFSVNQVLSNVENPVLSKLKVNDITRY